MTATPDLPSVSQPRGTAGQDLQTSLEEISLQAAIVLPRLEIFISSTRMGRDLHSGEIFSWCCYASSIVALENQGFNANNKITMITFLTWSLFPTTFLPNVKCNISCLAPFLLDVLVIFRVIHHALPHAEMKCFQRN